MATTTLKAKVQHLKLRLWHKLIMATLFALHDWFGPHLYQIVVSSSEVHRYIYLHCHMPIQSQPKSWHFLFVLLAKSGLAHSMSWSIVVFYSLVCVLFSVIAVLS